MRISDWSSDVCSSDHFAMPDIGEIDDSPAGLLRFLDIGPGAPGLARRRAQHAAIDIILAADPPPQMFELVHPLPDRKCVVYGKGVQSPVNISGRRSLTNKQFTLKKTYDQLNH